MEISEIYEFMAATAPFSYLSERDLAALGKQLTVYYCRAQEQLNLSGERIMIVRTGRFGIYSFEQQLIAEFQPGDCYGYPAVGLDRNRTVTCEEDGLVYWLPLTTLNFYREQNADFDAYFKGLSRHTLHQFKGPEQTEGVTLKIGDLVGPREVIIPPEAEVQHAAQLMTENRVSSLLIKSNGQLLGILTDRDLRSRVLAKGLPGDTPVSRVMTHEPFTVDKQAFVFEAVQLMSRHNIHHLPVLDGEHGYSMVTLTDIVRAQQNHPLYLIGEIHRQTDLAGLVACSAQMPQLLMQLDKQQVRALEAGHIVSTITDALTKRLLKIAEKQLGPPPCAFSWLAFGSQARMDQSINADQDNALLLEREPKSADERDYFRSLAQFVCHGLDQCGIRLCPGNIMATNDELRLSLRGWQDKLHKLVQRPDPQAILRSSIYFDVRSIAGSNSLLQSLQKDILGNTQNSELFLFHLARAANERKAPLGFFKQFVVEHEAGSSSGFDLKKRGLSLITDIARVHALAAGLPEVNTVKRLGKLQQLQAMERRSANNLQAAFEVIAQLRWQNHLQQLQDGNTVTNIIDPSALHVLQRNQLKDAFIVINRAQAALQQKFCRSL